MLGGPRGHGGPSQHLRQAGTRSPGTFSSLAHAGRESGAAPLSQLGKCSCSRPAPHSHPPPAPTFSLRWAPPQPGGLQGASPNRWVCAEGRASAGWLRATQREPGTLSPLLSAIGSPLPSTVKCNTQRRSEEPEQSGGDGESRGGRQEAAGSSRGGDQRRGGRKGQTLVCLLWKRHGSGSPGGNCAEAHTHTPWSASRTAGSPGSGDVTCSWLRQGNRRGGWTGQQQEWRGRAALI